MHFDSPRPDYLFLALIFTLGGFVILASPAAADGTVDINIDPSSTFFIGTPGTYRLVSDVTMIAPVSAIVVTSPDVTIDLNGRTITGSGALNPGPGIDASAQQGVSIRNGRVVEFGGWGIYCGSNARIENVDVLASNNNGNAGGILAGDSSFIRHCLVAANDPGSDDTTGISVGSDSIVESNRVLKHFSIGSFFGISTGPRSHISGNTVSNNFGNGMSVIAINAGSSSIVRNNICVANGADTPVLQLVGIRIAGGCIASSNVCAENMHFDSLSGGGDVYGILTQGEGNRVEDNECSMNVSLGIGVAYGIEVGSNRNVVRNNTTQNHTTGGISITGDSNLIELNRSSEALPIDSGVSNTVTMSGDNQNLLY